MKRIIGHRSPSTGYLIMYAQPDITRRYMTGHIRRRGKRYEECHRTPDHIEWRGVTREAKAAIAETAAMFAQQEPPTP